MKPQFTEIVLTDLQFDPENPRLPERLKHSKDDNEIIKYFLLECNLIELMMSIAEKGFFAGEPLMIVPASMGKYTVVEGNRRLAALKVLNSIEPTVVMSGTVAGVREAAKHKPTSIPALLFSDRNDILTYLGYRHITGIKEWDSLAKARYLKQLRALHSEKDNNEAHRILAKEIGSKAATVAKLLTGYNLLEKANDIGILNRLKIEPDDIPFSLLTTGIGFQGIADFIGLSGAGDVEIKDIKERELEEFFTWVFDKKNRSHSVLGESRNFPKLSRIVANEAALDSLRRGDDLDSADLLTSGPLEGIRVNLYKAEQAIEAAQKLLTIANGITEQDADHAHRLKKSTTILFNSIKGLLAPEVEDD